jgi:ArsR family transcriptional regulator
MGAYIDRDRRRRTDMSPEQFRQVARALADPQRMAILERIGREGGELACRAIVQEFPISQATVSHHLKGLAEAGLIDARREAQALYLSLRRPTIEAYRRELGRRLSLES